jgi:uncharacterized membrane protein
VPTGDPGDPLTSWPALFATRWITHLCAPGFIALVGISVYLQRRRGKSAEQMTRMLLTRGVWLILLEVTVVSFAWAFSPSTYLQVIWAIGVSIRDLSVFVECRNFVTPCRNIDPRLRFPPSQSFNFNHLARPGIWLEPCCIHQ